MVVSMNREIPHLPHSSIISYYGGPDKGPPNFLKAPIGGMSLQDMRKPAFVGYVLRVFAQV